MNIVTCGAVIVYTKSQNKMTVNKKKLKKREENSENISRTSAERLGLWPGIWEVVCKVTVHWLVEVVLRYIDDEN